MDAKEGGLAVLCLLGNVLFMQYFPYLLMVAGVVVAIPLIVAALGLV